MRQKSIIILGHSQHRER